LNPLEAALRLAIAELAVLRVRFALVGGLAVSVRAEPRFTRDLDLAVSVDSDASAERLVGSLLARGWAVLSQIEQETTQRLATVRLAPPARQLPEGVVIDLLFASSGIEAEIVAGAEAIEVFAGVVAPVASVGHLLALKVLAHDERSRPQDRVDAKALSNIASPADLEVARRSLVRIEALGFHRGKNLTREIESLLEP
jgi:hypothetical protein